MKEAGEKMFRKLEVGFPAAHKGTMVKEAAKGQSWSASIIGPLNYLDWGDRQHYRQD